MSLSSARKEMVQINHMTDNKACKISIVFGTKNIITFNKSLNI